MNTLYTVVLILVGGLVNWTSGHPLLFPQGGYSNNGVNLLSRYLDFLQENQMLVRMVNNINPALSSTASFPNIFTQRNSKILGATDDPTNGLIASTAPIVLQSATTVPAGTLLTLPTATTLPAGSVVQLPQIPTADLSPCGIGNTGIPPVSGLVPCGAGGLIGSILNCAIIGALSSPCGLLGLVNSIAPNAGLPGGGITPGLVGGVGAAYSLVPSLVPNVGGGGCLQCNNGLTAQLTGSTCCINWSILPVLSVPPAPPASGIPTTIPEVSQVAPVNPSSSPPATSSSPATTDPVTSEISSPLPTSAVGTVLPKL